MRIIEKDENGVCDCTCKEGEFYLAYGDTDKKYVFHGEHTGQITGKCIIEVFDTEDEMNERIETLGVVLPNYDDV